MDKNSIKRLRETAREQINNEIKQLIDNEDLWAERKQELKKIRTQRILRSNMSNK